MKLFRLMLFTLFIIAIFCLSTVNAFDQEESISRFLAFSPDGSLVAVSTEAGIILVDSTSGQSRHILTGANGSVTRLAWSPSGTYIAAMDDYQTIYIWNVNNDIRPLSIKGHSSGTTALLWSLDEIYLFGFGIEDSENWWHWEVETGNLVKTTVVGTIINGATSPLQGKLALVNIFRVLIYDSRSYEVLASLSQPSHHDNGFNIYPIAWSADETKIVTGSRNSAVQVWDAVSGKILRTWLSSDKHFVEESDLIYGVVFNQAGDKVISIRGDGLFQYWNIDRSDVLEELQLPTEIALASISSYGGRIAVIAKSSYRDLWEQESYIRLGDSDAHITVPFPSLERVKDIGAACARDAQDKAAAEMVLNPAALDVLATNTLTDFTSRIETLPENVIPTACKIDLLAVARAVQ